METAQNKFIAYFSVLGCPDLEISHFDEYTNLRITIEERFPLNDYPDAALPELFPMFCFPGGVRAFKEMKEPTFFCFTLTELTGERFYGACLTFYEKTIPKRFQSDFIDYNSDSEAEEFSKSEVSDYSQSLESTDLTISNSSHFTTVESVDKSPVFYTPKCLAILSRHPYFSTFRECLRELFLIFRTRSSSIPFEHYISYLIHNIPLPPPNYTVQFQLNNKKLLFSTPPSHFFSLMEFSASCIFESLGIKGVLEIFSFILSEQKIVFCSQHYTLLTIAAETIIQLIFPFQWHHIYIPILPQDLLEFLEAPTPFIVGIHIDFIDNVLSVPGVIIVDLDSGKINKGNAKVVLPPLHTQELIKKLEMILYPQLFDMDAAFPRSSHLFLSSSTKSSNPMLPGDGEEYITNRIRLAFLQFFIDLFSNFRDYISFLRKFPQPVTIFNKAKYIKDNNPSAVEFLTIVLETQAFSMLLENQHQEFTIFEVVIRAQHENIPISAIWNFKSNSSVESEQYFIDIPPLSNHFNQSELIIDPQSLTSVPIFPKLKQENYVKLNLPHNNNNHHQHHHHHSHSRHTHSHDHNQQQQQQQNNQINIHNSENDVDMQNNGREFENFGVQPHLMNIIRRSAVKFEGSKLQFSNNNANNDPAKQFIEDSLLLILKEQVIPNESILLLNDLVKIEQSRLVLVKYLKSYSDKMKGSITDLTPQYFNYLSGITEQLLEEAKSSNDFTSPAILMASSGSFRLQNTDEFLHQRYKKHSIFHNKYFWESAFFESVAREREELPDQFKVGVTSVKWEELEENVKLDYETREANILFGLLGSFAMHMLNLGISAKEASTFLQQMSRLCDLASEQVQELQTLVATMQQINDILSEDLDVTPRYAANQRNEIKDSKTSENFRLEYFATSSSNSNDIDSKSLYRRLMEQKVKKETEQFSVEKEKACGFLIRTLKGYKKGISCMALHYPILATGEVNGAITLWNLIYNQTMPFNFNFHTDRITALAMNNNYLVCSSIDSNISVWNLQNGALEHKLTEHTAAVNCISLFGFKLVSGSDDSLIKVWNIKTGECLHTLNGHNDPITTIKIEGNFVVSGSKDRTVKVWEDWECRSTLVMHKDWIKLIDFNDNIIISASYDTKILIWDRHSRQLMKSLSGHEGIVNCFDFNDSILVSGSSDHTVRVWNIATGEQITVFQESERGDEISSVKIHPNSNDIIAGGFDGYIRIWNIKTGKLSCLSGHTDWVYTLIVHLIPAIQDDKVKKDKDKKEKKYKKDKKKETESLQTFLIISGSWDNTVKIWEQNILQRQSKKKKTRNFKFGFRN